jgi:hypothetical protein
MEAPSATDVMRSEGKIDVVDTGAGLFSDEVRPSQEQLTGEVEGATEGADKAGQTGADKSATAQPTGQDGKTDATGATEQEPGKDGEAKEEHTDEKGQKWVPHQALHEERSRRQQRDQELTAERNKNAILEAELTALRRQATERPKAPEIPAEFKDFKVLTDEEFAAKVDEDSGEAQKYVHKLARCQDWKRGEDARQADERRRQETTKARMAETNRQTAQLVQSSRDAIAQAVPGIYDESGEVSEKLVTFAAEHGMDPDYLAAITDPSTRIVITGDDGKPKVLLAAGGAVGLLKGLFQLYSRSRSSADEVARQAQEAAGKIIADKIRTDTGFKSIGDGPGASEIPTGDANKVYTEDDLLALRAKEGGEAERRRCLGV